MKDLLKIAYNALDEKKGENICIIDISGVSIIADYFIIVSGSNINQLDALTDNVEKKLGEAGVHPRQTEGKASGWTLMDYNDIVIHIFSKEDREFYDLERIWSDGKVVDIADL